MLVHKTYFQRIRSNDFTGHGRLGTVQDALSSKFVDVNSQIFLDILARFPVNISTCYWNLEISGRKIFMHD